MTIPQEIHADNHCPFCPDHKDYDFVWYELAEAYLCLGCRDEIECGLDFSEQPTKDQYNCADIFDKLLARLGISYAELQQRSAIQLEHGRMHK